MQLQPGRVTYYGRWARSWRFQGRSEQKDCATEAAGEAEAGGGSDEGWEDGSR